MNFPTAKHAKPPRLAAGTVAVLVVTAAVLISSLAAGGATASPPPMVPASIQSGLRNVYGFDLANLDPTTLSVPITADQAIQEAKTRFGYLGGGTPIAYFVSLTTPNTGTIPASSVPADLSSPPPFTPLAVNKPAWLVTIPNVTITPAGSLRFPAKHQRQKRRRSDHRRLAALGAAYVETLCVFVDPETGHTFLTGTLAS